MTYCKIDNKILFYLKLVVNCFRDSNYEKEFENVMILLVYAYLHEYFMDYQKDCQS